MPIDALRTRGLLLLPALVVGYGAANAAPAGAQAAAPAASSIAGTVVAVKGRWTADQSRIVSDVTIRDQRGTLHTVTQLGGSADGFGMRVFDGGSVLEHPLVVGEIVNLTTVVKATRSGDLVPVIERVASASSQIGPQGPAEFVRSGPTAAGKMLAWKSGCAQLYVDPQGTSHIAGDGEFAVINDAIATWNTGGASCSYMDIALQGQKTIAANGKDYTSVLIFREVEWCRPATDDDPERCYPGAAAAITTVTYVDDADSDRDGEIVDADIEFNGVDFSISNNGTTLGSVSCKSDLKNTLVHEFGHYLGLEHTCRADGDPARIDNQGRAVPLCSGTVDPAIVDATMYNYQECGETSKATLAQDDIDGMCGIYPKANDPKVCEAPDTGDSCCGVGGGRAPWTSVLAIALIAFGLRRRRR